MWRITCLLGPRQCGKTSAARAIAGKAKAHYFDLEDPDYFECLQNAEAAGSPGMTRSLHEALKDLKPKRIWVVHPGEKAYPLHEKVDALPLSGLETLRKTIGIKT